MKQAIVETTKQLENNINDTEICKLDIFFYFFTIAFYFNIFFL